MDLQFFLALNVIAASALVALQAVVTRAPGYAGWLAVNLLVIAIAGAALWWAAEWAGVISVGAFLPLVLAPAVFSNMAQRRANMSRYGEAALYSRLAALLHPTPASRFAAELSTAWAESEEKDDVAPLFELMARSTPEQKATISALIARSRGRWADALDTVRASPSRRELASVEIRALGETGRIEEMLRVFEDSKASLAGYHLLFGQLFVLAFAGRPEAADRLLSAQLASLDNETKAYWRAVAALNAPSTRGQGRAALERIAMHARRATTRHAAEHHLSVSAIAPSAGLTPRALAIVDTTERQVAHVARFAGVRTWHLPATLLLITLNALVFGIEEGLGGSEDLETLVRLGALWPPLVLEEGEWWRLVAPSFLHFGLLHLVVNMLMLLMLGRIVETSSGWRWLLTGYLAGGIGSSAATLLLMREGIIPSGVLVGASGAVFTLFGMMVARHIVDWRQSRDVLDRRRLVSLALVLAVQFVIDTSVPQISLSAHLSGLLIGLALGLWSARGSPPSRSAKVQ